MDPRVVLAIWSLIELPASSADGFNPSPDCHFLHSPRARKPSASTYASPAKANLSWSNETASSVAPCDCQQQDPHHLHRTSFS